MNRLVTLVICLAVALPAAAGAGTAPRKLVREASRVSGFAVRRPVQTSAVAAPKYRTLYSRAWAREYPSTLRRADSAAYKQLGLVARAIDVQAPRAWYDVSAKKVLVQRRPAASRRALVHEVVRALIDQNYGLKRLAGLRTRDRDRWLAANAIVNGTAALTSGLRAGTVRGTPLDRFSTLQRDAGLGPGRALAAELRYLGGGKAVVSALQTFPQTTEQLLHVDKFLEREQARPVPLPSQAGGLHLVSSETFGELDVRNLLQAFAVPAAATVAEGWGGGRIALYGDVAAVVLRWDTPEDAVEWQAAIPKYVAAAFAGAPSRTCPPLDRCWATPGGDVAAGIYGTTAVLASGPNAAAVASQLLSVSR